MAPPESTRKGLVQAVTAEIRPQMHGVPVLRREPQLGAVGVVHQQRYPVPVTDLRQSGDVSELAEVVGEVTYTAAASGFRRRASSAWAGVMGAGAGRRRSGGRAIPASSPSSAMADTATHGRCVREDLLSQRLHQPEHGLMQRVLLRR